MNKVNYPPELESDKLPAGCLPDLLWPPEIGVELPEELNLTEWFLDRNLEGEQADRIAFYSGERAITYRTLSEWVNRFANALRDLGVEKGDRVMLRIANSVEYVVSALAVGRLAAVVVPTMTLLRAKVLIHDANTSEAKVVICGYDLLGEIEAGRDQYATVKHIISIGGDPEELQEAGACSATKSSSPRPAIGSRASGCHPDSLAAVFFTSGTTGTAQGLHASDQQHHRLGALVPAHLRGSQAHRCLPRLAAASPLSSASATTCCCRCSPAYPASSSRAGCPSRPLLEAISEVQGDRCSMRCLPPSIRLLNLPNIDDYDLSSLRVVMSGSAPLLASTFQQVQGPHRSGDRERYRLDGVSRDQVRSPTYPDTSPEATGWPVPGVQAKVIDEEGNECPPGVTGPSGRSKPATGRCTGATWSGRERLSSTAGVCRATYV